MPDKPVKSLAVFDIDGTVLDFFDTMRRVVDPFHEKLAESRGMTRDELRAKMQASAHAEVKRTGGKSDQFGMILNSPGKVIDVMDFLQPRRDSDDLLEHDLRKSFNQEMRFFDDVPETFANIALDENNDRNGVGIAFLTDGQRSAVIQRLALCAKKADEAGVLPEGVKFMDLVDAVYTQPDPPGVAAIEAAMPTMDPALRPYVDAIAKKTVALPPGTHKPDPAGLEQVMSDFGRMPVETVMVGDTVNDGGAAVSTGVEFVWQKDGADVPPETVRMQDEIGDGHYVIGLEATSSKMVREGVLADHIAENGCSDIRDFYEFKSDRPHAAPALSQTLEGQRPTTGPARKDDPLLPTRPKAMAAN